MKREIRDRWVTRLLKTQIPQGTGVLRNDKNESCPLDILCRIAVEDGVLPPPVLHSYLKKDGTHGMAYHYAERGGAGTSEFNYLPEIVQEWAGLNDEDPGLIYDDPEWGEMKVAISTLNDAYNLSFFVIGGIIDDSEL